MPCDRRAEPEDVQPQAHAGERGVVLGGRCGGIDLAANAVDACGLHLEPVEQRSLGHREVGAFVVGRHAALVSPPELDAAPVGLQSRRGLVRELRARAAGERDVTAVARRFGQQLSRAARGSGCIVEDDQVDAHGRFCVSVSLVGAAFDRVCEAVNAALEETQTPGVAVGLLHAGEEDAAGFGVTSLENPLDVTPDTLFQIGSITKTFTGTAAMRLVERGELDLDAPVRTYLPELKLSDEDVAARVTTRHLLTHTGGWIGDHFDDLGSGDDALARICASMSSLPQLTPLGEVWSYNNAGFYLAGRVIEVLSGKPYEEAMQELVLEPLGLEQTFFSPTT